MYTESGAADVRLIFRAPSVAGDDAGDDAGERTVSRAPPTAHNAVVHPVQCAV